MSTYKKAGSSEYAVGKGRPPVASRFRPGQSGNPKGRPKGSKGLMTYFEEALSKKHPIRENGKVRYADLREIIVKAVIARAAKGDLKSLFYLLEIEPRVETVSAAVDWKNITAEEASRTYQEIMKRSARPL